MNQINKEENENQEKNLVNSRRCKRCQSLQTYIRFKDKSKICRSCGFVEVIDED